MKHSPSAQSVMKHWKLTTTRVRTERGSPDPSNELWGPVG